MAEVMTETTHEPNGQTIGMLDRLQSSRDNDLILISRTNDEDNPKSYSIYYGDLRKQIISDIKNRLGIRTMAYENEWKYALSGHVHENQYNSLSIHSLVDT